MSKEKKKLLDIPESTLKVLAKMATEARMSVKAYMELILIEFAKNNKN